MAERFHVNCPLSPGSVALDGPEARHLAVVCRARPGDAVCLFNGDGHDYQARVVEVSKKQVLLDVIGAERVDRELPFVLHLAVSLPKGDRAAVLVEKLTELGVGVLTLLSCERSVVQPREAKVEKLHRQVIEASKQCRRNVLMRLDGPRGWGEFVRDATLPACRLVAHPADGVLPAPPMGVDVVAAVGPEGGLTDDEVALAVAAGWRPIALGPRILRVETAALAVAARLGAAW